MTNSDSIKARFTNLDNPAIVLYSDSACSQDSSTQLSCDVPSSVATYGQYVLALVDGTDNSVKLNDDAILFLNIIAKPEIDSVATDYSYSTTLSVASEDVGIYGPATHYHLTIDVEIDSSANSVYLANYKTEAMPLLLCRL